jgi:hypothetical protein
LFHSVQRGSHAAAPVREFLSMHVKAQLMTCEPRQVRVVEIHSPSARVPGFGRKGWGIPQAWPINTQHMPVFPRGKKCPGTCIKSSRARTGRRRKACKTCILRNNTKREYVLRSRRRSDGGNAPHRPAPRRPLPVAAPPRGGCGLPTSTECRLEDCPSLRGQHRKR